MANQRPNMEVVKQLRKLLNTQGLLNHTAIAELISTYQKKKEATNFFSFATKRDLALKISALTYLLENEISKN
tara:strand:+ start:11910 stop:12128 length:219 start_codon:yes stop_codon:yes gene_type:complete